MRRLRGVSGTGEVKIEGVYAGVGWRLKDEGGCGILKIG